MGLGQYRRQKPSDRQHISRPTAISFWADADASAKTFLASKWTFHRTVTITNLYATLPQLKRLYARLYS
jgi:mannose/fructose/N-acetylgalactosamine-specific phosphotransferase system component IID